MYPHERSLVKSMQGKPFALVGVNSDSSKTVAKKAVKDEKLTWRSFWNGGGTGGPISKKFGVSGWPTMYVLDGNGVIRFKWVGSPGEARMNKAIQDLVAELEREGKATE